MTNFKATFDGDATFKAKFDSDANFKAKFQGVQIIPTGDYNDLANKPIEYDTTEAWNSQPTKIAELGHLYFYTDHQTIGGVNIAGVKFGDGTSYLIDLPFMDARFEEHIGDTIVHITQEEREFWNNKNRALITGENLILTHL